MAWSLTAERTGSVATPASATTPGNFSFTSTAGRLLVLLLAHTTATATFASVTDSAGNTWTKATAAPPSGTAGRRVEIWYCANAAAISSLSFQCTATTAGTAFVSMHEFTGFKTNPFDQANSFITSTTTSPPPCNVTPTATDDLIIAMVMANNNQASQCTTTAEWTRLTTDNSGHAAVYKTTATSGVATAPQWTMVNAVGDGQATIAFLKDTTVPIGPTVTVWDGTQEVAATIAGVWDGTQIVPASVSTIS